MSTLSRIFDNKYYNCYDLRDRIGAEARDARSWFLRLRRKGLKAKRLGREFFTTEAWVREFLEQHDEQRQDCGGDD